MESFKEKYMALNSTQLLMITIIALLLEFGLIYKLGFERYIADYKSKQENLKRQKSTIETQKVNIERLKLEITGKPGEKLNSAHMADLAETGNSIEYLSHKDDLISELKKLGQRVGGKSVQITEEQLEDGYINSGNRVFKTKMLPLEISMTTNYSGASNFLFQLKSMERLIKIKSFQMDSSDYIGTINAVINVDAYFIDDTDAVAEAPEGEAVTE